MQSIPPKVQYSVYVQIQGAHISGGASAVLGAVLVHIVCWEKAHLETEAAHMRKDPRVAILSVHLLADPYPAVDFSFPPSTVALLGENLDSVSFLQRQLGAIAGREVVSGSGDAEALGAASCRTSSMEIENRRKSCQVETSRTKSCQVRLS